MSNGYTRDIQGLPLRIDLRWRRFESNDADCELRGPFCFAACFLLGCLFFFFFIFLHSSSFRGCSFVQLHVQRQKTSSSVYYRRISRPADLAAACPSATTVFRFPFNDPMHLKPLSLFHLSGSIALTQVFLLPKAQLTPVTGRIFHRDPSSTWRLSMNIRCISNIIGLTALKGTREVWHFFNFISFVIGCDKSVNKYTCFFVFEVIYWKYYEMRRCNVVYRTIILVFQCDEVNGESGIMRNSWFQPNG